MKRKEDIFSKVFDFFTNEQNDSIGLGEGDKGLMVFNLKDKAIKGIVCSENFSM